MLHNRGWLVDQLYPSKVQGLSLIRSSCSGSPDTPLRGSERISMRSNYKDSTRGPRLFTEMSMVPIQLFYNVHTTRPAQVWLGWTPWRYCDSQVSLTVHFTTLTYDGVRKDSNFFSLVRVQTLVLSTPP